MDTLLGLLSLFAVCCIPAWALLGMRILSGCGIFGGPA